MKFTVNTLAWLSLISCVAISSAKKCNKQCSQGGEIFTWGISSVDKNIILKVHNRFREMIRKGTVPKQPRGKNVKSLNYDAHLGTLARNVTKLCKIEHVNSIDQRWSFVGQNLYMERSSIKHKAANWEKAITKWYEEHKFYYYPNTPSKSTGHYTQVVAQNTTFVGCDYIFFYDTNKPTVPYSKLYACNYGPAGNIKGHPPYIAA